MVRDINSTVARVISGRTCDSTKAEIVGLLMGLGKLRKMEAARNCIVEGNSTMVIAWGMGKGEGSWQLAHVIYEIRDLAFFGAFLLHMPKGSKHLSQ